MYKKFLSLFLAFALLIGQTPAVFAAESDVLEETTVIEQVVSEELTVDEQNVTEDSSVDVQEESEEPVVDAQEDAEESSDVINEEVTMETEEEVSDEGADDEQAGSDEGKTEVSFTMVPDVDLPDNDELFAAYAESVLYGNSISTFGTAAGARLNSDEKLLYDALVPYIRQIAAGERASATISVGQSTDSNSVDTEVVFSEDWFDGEVSNVVNALLSDCPYEMYWFDKLSGYGYTYPTTQVTVKFIVSAKYRGADAYTADTSKTGAATNAAAVAREIVANYAGKTDSEKLEIYKNEICDLVSYNWEAAYAGNFTENSDPWQLIYVFDGDSATNVVCEGYSKAFMYLCDLSDFTGDVACYTVSGTMDGGGHMWNIVTMDGCNYLADVTNSESDSIGYDGSLFLVTGEGSAAGGYDVSGISYVYDADTIAIWGTDADSILTLGSNNEDGSGGDSYLVYHYVNWDYELGEYVVSDVENVDFYQEYPCETQIIFYIIGADGSKTPVAAEDLVCDSGLVSFAHTQDANDDYVTTIILEDIGTGEICVKDAAEVTPMAAEVVMRNLGFYTQPVAAPAYYIDRDNGGVFNITEDNRTVYFVAANGYKLTAISLQGDLASYASYEMSDEADYAAITFNDNLPATDSEGTQYSFIAEYESPLYGSGGGFYGISVVYQAGDSGDDTVVSGTCGENLTWTLTDGMLTISGTGAMYNYLAAADGGDHTSPFANSTEITGVIVKEGVSSIGSYAFEGCPLTLVHLPTTLEAVYPYAFAGCDQILCILYPEGSVVDWLNVSLSSGNDALFTAEMMLKDGGKIGEELYWQIIDGTLTFMARGTGSGMYESENGEPYEMPWAEYADQITKIDMQKGITICDGAFAGLTKVTELALPAYLLYFQDAIGDLTALEKIEIPAENDGGYEVTADGKALLRSNTEVEGTYTLYAVAPTVSGEFTVPAGVTCIHFNAFKNCTGITTLNIPASTALVLENAFNGCSVLTTVNYDGAESEWADVVILDGNDPLLNATVVFADSDSGTEDTEQYLAYSYVNYDDEVGDFVAESELYTTYGFDYPRYTSVQFFRMSSDGTKIPVRWESLVSGNTDIFTVEGVSDENPYVCFIVPNGVGSTSLRCDDWSMDVSISLPTVAYYTQPIADVAYFIDMDSSAFEVTKSNRTVYLVLEGQRTFTNVELQGELADYASVEILSAGNAAAITFNDNLPVTNQWGTRYQVYQQFDSNEPGESGGGGFRTLRVINNSVSRLYLNWAQWREDGCVDEGVGGESELSITPGSEYLLYIHFDDGETDITVPASQLTVGDESVVSVTCFEEYPDVAIVKAHSIGETYIAYSSDGIEYQLPVVCELPTYGFYLAPEATEANYLQEFVLSESFNTLYYIARDGYTMKDVVLANGGAESSIVLSDDGTIATITLGSEFYETYFVKVIYTEVSPNGYEVTNASDYAYFDVDVSEPTASPYLVLYHAWFQNGNELTIDSDNPITQWYCTPYTTYAQAFLSVDGKEVAIDPAQLVSGDENVVTIEVYDEQPEFCYIDFCGFGETTLSYTHTDGNTYTVSVFVGLPEVGFFSQPVCDEQYYLRAFNVTEDDDTIYLVAQDGWSFSDLTLENAPTGTTVTVNDEGTVATIQLPHACMQNTELYVHYVVATPYGGSWNTTTSITLSSSFPGLYYRNPVWDEYGNAYEDLSQPTYTSFDTFPKKGTFAIPYFFDGTTEYKLSGDQLYSDNTEVVDINLYNQFPVIEPTGFGNANICYEHTDGTIYKIPVSVELFYADFYSTPEPSKDSFLYDFTVTNTNRTFYLAALDGFTISNVQPGDNWPESDFVVSDDGSYVTITIKEGAEWNENWGGSNLMFDLVGENGINWTNHFEWIILINGGDKMIFRYAMYDQDGAATPDPSYADINYYGGPIYGTDIFLLMSIEGEETVIDPTKVTCADSSILEITPDPETNTLYMNPVGFGETYLSYTHTDGNTYKLNVYIILPDVAFYTKPVASEEYFIRDFVLSDDNDTVYLVARNGVTFSNLELSGFPEGTSFEVSDDNTVATIKMGHNPVYGDAYAGFIMYNPEGQGWNNGMSFRISSVYPTFAIYYANYNDGVPSPSTEYFFTEVWTLPMVEDIFPMMLIDGQLVSVDPAKVSVADESIIKAAPNADVPTALQLDSMKIGQTELLYEHEGVAYSIPVYVDRPLMGFYTSADGKDEEYIREFELTEDNNVIYLVADEMQYGDTMLSITLTDHENFPEGTIFEATDKENVIKITIPTEGYIGDSFYGLIYRGYQERPDGRVYNYSAECGMTVQGNNPCENGHTEVIDEAIAVTCTRAGLTEGKHCSVCGEVIVAQKPIPATGHYYGEVVIVAEPTCTTDGEAYAKCTECSAALYGRNADEVLVRKLTNTAYMIAGAGVYDYGPEYIINEIAWNYCVNYEQSWEFVVPAADFEAEVGKYFKMDTMMIQMLREYAASMNPEYASVYYDAESNTYTVRTVGGFGGWLDECQYVGYVQNDGLYTAYYCTVNYIFLVDVMTDAWSYAESLGYPETIEYEGHTFTNGPDGYYYIESIADSGCAVVMEPNENVMRIVSVSDFTAAELPTEFDDVDGGMTGHLNDSDNDYICDDCGAELCVSHIPTAIPAVEATCTEDGLTEGTKCDNCGKILEQQEVVPKIDHEFQEWVGRTPSCDLDGITPCYYCLNCEKYFDINDKTKELDDVHYGEPTGHHFVVVDGKEPTCTEAGNLPYRYCDNSYTFGTETVECHERYITIDGVEESWRPYIEDGPMIERAQLAVVPHTEETIPAVAPTCTATGLTEGSECSVCGEIVKAQEEVSMTAHDVSYVEPKEPTFTAAGCNEHYKCNDCGALFLSELDAADNKPCAKEEAIIPQIVEVSAGKAEVNEEVMEEAISNSTDTTVTLPLTEAKEETTAAQLPVASLEKIKDAEKELTVETNFAIVTIDNKALDTIVSEAGDADSIELVVEEIASEKLTEKLTEKQQETVSQKKIEAVISAEIICGDETISQFEGGTITVRIPFIPAAGCKISNYIIIYIDENGNVTNVSTEHGDGYLEAELPHFSEYAIEDIHEHIEDAAVVENETAATCTTAGSYDSVVYCTECSQELTRETVTVPATDHNDVDGDGKCDNAGCDDSVVLLGDINGDGVIDGRDVVRLARFLGEVSGTEIHEKNADVNADDVVDGRDIIRLARFMAEDPGVELG